MAADPPSPDVLKRTTVMVRDAEAAARWYEAAFGMTRAMDTPFTLSGRQLAAGAAGDRTRLVIMAGGDAGLGAIGLLQWVDPPMDAPAEPASRIAFGQPIFVVAAADCRATVERARAAGGRVHCEPYEWTVTGFDGSPQRMLGASLFDPDGYFFEVNERLA